MIPGRAVVVKNTKNVMGPEMKAGVNGFQAPIGTIQP
jgi:hypothetical protein